MPLPTYIICSLSGAQDAATGSVSAFDILESIQFAALPQGQLAAAPLMRVVSTWMRQDDDMPETRFQAELVLHIPNMAQEQIATPAPVEFVFARPLQRLTWQGIPITDLHGPGTMYVEVRVRRSGEQNWLGSHRFPIIVQEIAIPPQASEATATAPA
jgi:hypothetical protein